MIAKRIDGLAVRRRLGRDQWGVPQPFGPQGWLIDHRTESARIIVTVAEHGDLPGDAREFVHASISRAEQIPAYEDLVDLHKAVWGDSGWSYQVFAPATEHVNIHAHALHLWGLLDGSPLLPNFGYLGSI